VVRPGRLEYFPTAPGHPAAGADVVQLHEGWGQRTGKVSSPVSSYAVAARSWVVCLIPGGFLPSLGYEHCDVRPRPLKIISYVSGALGWRILVPDPAYRSGMRVTYNKLIRGRIPEIIEANGHHAVTRVLGGEDYRAALLAKLVEEAQEAESAPADELPGELAHVWEVIQALADCAAYDVPGA
jgi:predicted house-cleaning noncanonical NTP pyrophosphatase (MazG superfamily)